MKAKVEWSDKEWDEYAEKLRANWLKEPISKIMDRYTEIETKGKDEFERIKLNEEVLVLEDLIESNKIFKALYDKIDELDSMLAEKEEKIQEMTRQLKKHKHDEDGDAYLVQQIG